MILDVAHQTVFPGQIRLIGIRNEPLTSWEGTLFYVDEITDWGFEMTPIKTVSWYLPHVRAEEFKKSQYRMDTGRTNFGCEAALTLNDVAEGGWVTITPADWTLEVLEDYVLDRPIRRDVERMGGQ